MLLFERGHVAMLREVMLGVALLFERDHVLGVAMLLFERGHVFVLGVAMLLFERGHVFVSGEVMYLCRGSMLREVVFELCC